MERYEAKHLGGFKRIYPREGGEKYDKYFKHSSSLFQETAASKAREECARYQSRSTKSRRLNQLAHRFTFKQLFSSSSGTWFRMCLVCL